MIVFYVDKGCGFDPLDKKIESDLGTTSCSNNLKELNCKKTKILAIFEKTALGERLLALKEAEMTSIGVEGGGLQLELEFFFEYRPQTDCQAA